MYPYVLYIPDTDIRDWLYNGIDGRNRVAFVPRRVSLNCDLTETMGDFWRLGTWYCRTKLEAKELAKALAARHPGVQICIAKLESVAQAPASAAVFANYSDKGLIPE